MGAMWSTEPILSCIYLLRPDHIIDRKKRILNFLTISCKLTIIFSMKQAQPWMSSYSVFVVRACILVRFR